MSVNIYNKDAGTLIELATNEQLLKYTVESGSVSATATGTDWLDVLSSIQTQAEADNTIYNSFVECIVAGTSVVGFFSKNESNNPVFTTAACSRTIQSIPSGNLTLLSVLTSYSGYGLKIVDSTSNLDTGIYLVRTSAGGYIHMKSDDATLNITADSQLFKPVTSAVLTTMKSNASAYHGCFYNDTDGYYIFDGSTYTKLNETTSLPVVAVACSVPTTSNNRVLRFNFSGTGTYANLGGILADQMHIQSRTTTNYTASAAAFSSVPAGIFVNTGGAHGVSVFDYIFNQDLFNSVASDIEDASTTPSGYLEFLDYIVEHLDTYTEDDIEYYRMPNSIMNPDDVYSDPVQQYVASVGLAKNTYLWSESMWHDYIEAIIYLLRSLHKPDELTLDADKIIFYDMLPTDGSITWDSGLTVSRADWYSTYHDITVDILTKLATDDLAWDILYEMDYEFYNGDILNIHGLVDKNRAWMLYKLFYYYQTKLLKPYTTAIQYRLRYMGGLQGTVTVNNSAVTGAEPEVQFLVSPEGIFVEEDGENVCVVPKVRDTWNRRESISIATESLPHTVAWGYNTVKERHEDADPFYNAYYDDDTVYGYDVTTATPALSYFAHDHLPTYQSIKANAEMTGRNTTVQVQQGTRKIDVALPLASKYSDIGDGSCTVPLTLGNFARLLFGNKFDKTKKEFGGHLRTGDVDALPGAHEPEDASTHYDSDLEISEESGWANMGLFDVSSRYVSDYLSVAGIGYPDNKLDYNEKDMTNVTQRSRIQRSTGSNAVQYYSNIRNSNNRFPIGSAEYVGEDGSVGVAYTANALDFPVTGCMSLRTHIPLHSREMSSANLPYIPGYCYPFGGTVATGYSSGNCDNKLYVEPTAQDGVGFNANDVRQFPMHQSECANSQNYTAGGHGKTMIPVFGRMLTLMSCVAQQLVMVDYNGEWTGTRSPLLSGYFWSAINGIPSQASIASQNVQDNYFGAYEFGTSSQSDSRYISSVCWSTKLNLCNYYSTPRDATKTANFRVSNFMGDNTGGPGQDNDMWGRNIKVTGTGCVYHPGYKLVQHIPGIDCGIYTGIVSGVKLGCAQFRQYQSNTTTHANNMDYGGNAYDTHGGENWTQDPTRDTEFASNGLAGTNTGAPSIITDTTSTLSYTPGSGVSWRLQFDCNGFADILSMGPSFGTVGVDPYTVHDFTTLMNSKVYGSGVNRTTAITDTYGSNTSATSPIVLNTLANVFTLSFPTGMPEFGLANTAHYNTWLNLENDDQINPSRSVRVRVRIFNGRRIVTTNESIRSYGGVQYGLAGYTSVTGQQFNLTTVEPFAITVMFGSSMSASLCTPLRLPADDVRVHWYNNVANSSACGNDPFNSGAINTWAVGGVNNPSELCCDIDVHISYLYKAQCMEFLGMTSAEFDSALSTYYGDIAVACYNTDGLAFCESATATMVKHLFSGKLASTTTGIDGKRALRNIMHTNSTKYNLSTFGAAVYNPVSVLEDYGIHAAEQILDGFGNYVNFPKYVYDDDNFYIAPSCPGFSQYYYPNYGDYIAANSKCSDSVVVNTNHLTFKPFNYIPGKSAMLAMDADDHTKFRIYYMNSSSTTNGLGTGNNRYFKEVTNSMTGTADNYSSDMDTTGTGTCALGYLSFSGNSLWTYGNGNFDKPGSSYMVHS